MGGDDAPAVPAAAARIAVEEHGLDVVLVGDAAMLRELAPSVPAIAASDVIAMGEEPALAVRGKPDASVRVAMRLLVQGLAGAVVSAGSTGATLAAALLELGRLPQVRRPVLAAVLPTSGSGTVLVDAGASGDVQPAALVASARMGTAYARVRGAARPRLGLLNVGAEPGKGNELARAAHDLLAGLPGFVGNVEPQAVLAGGVDVLVTDGFTGNIFLKTLEAARPPAKGTGPGAAALLGVPGEVLVAHGAAGAAELVAALRTADALAMDGLSRLIAAGLAAD